MRETKYRLVPNPAERNGRSVRVIRKSGIMMFNPTSTPTIKRIPRKSNKTFRSSSSDRVERSPARLTSSRLSGMPKHNQISDSRETTAYKRNVHFQLPQQDAAAPTRIGPRKEERDLMNCPNVSVLATLPADTTPAISGLSETCRIVLLIPSRANANQQIRK